MAAFLIPPEEDWELAVALPRRHGENPRQHTRPTPMRQNIIDDICHTGRWWFQNSTRGVTSATRLGNVSAARRTQPKIRTPASPALYRRKPASPSQIFIGL